MVSLFYHLKTLFLFTKSDMKTTVIPVVSTIDTPLILSRLFICL